MPIDLSTTLLLLIVFIVPILNWLQKKTLSKELSDRADEVKEELVAKAVEVEEKLESSEGQVMRKLDAIEDSVDGRLSRALEKIDELKALLLSVAGNNPKVKAALKKPDGKRPK